MGRVEDAAGRGILIGWARPSQTTRVHRDEIIDDLRAEGVDVERMANENQVSARLGEARLAWQGRAKRERQAFFGGPRERGGSRARSPSAEELRTRISETLRRLAGAYPETVAVHFRKLQEAAENDLEGILEDLERLESGEAKE